MFYGAAREAVRHAPLASQHDQPYLRQVVQDEQVADGAQG